MALEQSIQRIEDKLQLLVKKLQQVQGENVLLREQLQTLEETINAQQGIIDGMENKLHLAKMAVATQGAPATREEDDEFKKEMRSRINDYIREIDRCIALLNS